MDISLSLDNAHAMAKRLRSQVPDMTASTSREVLATVLGYRNWDTLNGMLKRAGSPAAPARSEEFLHRARLVNYREAPPKGFKPFELYCSVSALDEWADSPDCYQMTITEEVVAHLHRLQTTSLETGLALSEDGERFGEWLSTGFMNMRHDLLHVNDRRFYFSARPKHGEATSTVESRAIDFDEFFDLIEKGKKSQHQSAYFAWAGDLLLRDPGSVRGFAEEQFSNGHFDIDIDEMEALPG